MHALLSSSSSSSYPYRFFMYTWGLFIVLFFILVRTNTVAAQVEPSRPNEILATEKNYYWRFGIHFSAYGALTSAGCQLDYECYDHLPYPISNMSVNYKDFEIVSGWGSDENEFIFNFFIRYNYYLLRKYRFRPVLFAGINTWYFHKKWIYRLHSGNSPEAVTCQNDYYYCSWTDNLIRYERITDPELSYEIDSSRPDGKSISSGITIGIGVEYNIGRIVFTHELEGYQNLSGCPYSEFICRIPDFKFLGVHFQF